MKKVRWGLVELVALGVLFAASHSVFAADTDSLVVNESGYVGVGTNSPKNYIHVHNPGTSFANIQFTNSNTGQGTSTDGFRVGLSSTSDGAVFVGENNALLFGTNNTERMHISNTGNVGIGTATPEYMLDVHGYISAENVAPSDVRWKKDINRIEDGLDLVTQLRGVSYSWIDPSRGEGRKIGVIAQEVEKVIPEVVHTDSQGYKSVEYAKLVAPLIEAVKALKAENDSLKAELRQREDELEKRIEAIEDRLAD